ncbi:MAG: hypothetical protein JSV85_01115 [Candidatus Bathyarchaeota archaeon]|nr:MAG: hypothetical protein JSV85_01115 [Candidatus Bathyarchaeota archaeon]
MSKKSKFSRRPKRKKRTKQALFASAFIIISIAVTAWYVTSRPTPTPTHPPRGTLVVRTIEEFTDEPLSDMTIGLLGPAHAIGQSNGQGEYINATVQSNEQGEYIFESIPIGEYVVAAWKDEPYYHATTGSRTSMIGVEIVAQVTERVVIKLHGHNQTS